MIHKKGFIRNNDSFGLQAKVKQNETEENSRRIENLDRFSIDTSGAEKVVTCRMTKFSIKLKYSLLASGLRSFTLLTSLVLIENLD